jgi:hypothetical protein
MEFHHIEYSIATTLVAHSQHVHHFRAVSMGVASSVLPSYGLYHRKTVVENTDRPVRSRSDDIEF